MSQRHHRSAPRALADSALSLLVACIAIAMFLPPWASATAGAPLRSAIAIAVIALAVPLHWVFLGIAARRLGASVAGWVAMAVALFPVGGVAALLLLAWPPAHAEGQPSAG